MNTCAPRSLARFIFRSVAAADCDAAIAHFSRAIELDPEFAWLMTVWARAT